MKIVMATFKFTPSISNPEELELWPGELILLIEKDIKYKDGWWKGISLVSKRLGLFPFNRVMEHVPHEMLIKHGPLLKETLQEVLRLRRFQLRLREMGNKQWKLEKRKGSGGSVGGSRKTFTYTSRRIESHQVAAAAAVAYQSEDAGRSSLKAEADSLYEHHEVVNSSRDRESREAIPIDTTHIPSENDNYQVVDDDSESQLSNNNNINSNNINNNINSNNISSNNINNGNINNNFPLILEEWSPEHVAMFLQNCQNIPASIAQVFLENEIDGDVILDLDEDALMNDMGIAEDWVQPLLESMEYLRSIVQGREASAVEGESGDEGFEAVDASQRGSSTAGDESLSFDMRASLLSVISARYSVLN